MTEQATEMDEKMDEVWAETIVKFQSLQTQVQENYELLERRTKRGIDAFQAWIAGDQSSPRSDQPRYEPEPLEPNTLIEGSGPPIAI